MADPLSPEEARRRFQAVSRGRHATDTSLDLAGAKQRLREADPGVDIAPTLRHLGERRWQPAALSLLPWLVSDAGRAYMAPLLLRMAEGAYTALELLKRNLAAHRSAPPSHKAGPSRKGSAGQD